MATIGLVRLNITSRSRSTTSTATVRYTITFSNADVSGNLRYLETIQLFGGDPPPGAAGDDLLFTFPSRIVRPNGQRTLRRTRNAEVPNSALDEGRGGQEDEIYARVCLRALDPGGQGDCRHSGQISMLVAEALAS